MATSRRPYPTDFSDAEWQLIRPMLPRPKRQGRPLKWPLRLTADAIFYVVRSGCPWRLLPHEYPPWQTIYWHFRQWQRSGVLRRVHTRLRERVRQREGRSLHPSGAVIDSQSVRCSGHGGPERGYDGAKRLAGRKRHLLVDTTGLVLEARVHAASDTDRTGGRRLLQPRLRRPLPRLEVVFADAAYTGQFRTQVAGRLGWQIQVVRHRDRHLWRYGLKEQPKGFQVLPRRWVVERTFAWLGQSRRLSKDYEHLPEVSEAMIYLVMIRLMLRRLTKNT